MTHTTRRDLVKNASALAATSLLQHLPYAAKPPNILLIICDELSGGVLQDSSTRDYLKVPNLDRLVSRSLSFTRAYAATPLCVPARTAIFTGTYPIQNGVETNDPAQFDAQRFPCLGRFVRSAGYETAYFGKWHLPYLQADINKHGFETMGTSAKPNDTETASLASRFLARKHDQPFFCVASFLEPHNICEWARGEALDQGEVGPPPPASQLPPLRPNHAPQQNEPDAVRIARASYQAARMFPVGKFSDIKWRQYEWAYYRMIELLDLQVGRVLDALEKASLTSDTAVIFLSDHGDCQGAHNWNQKTVFYDESSRVPLLLSYPRQISRGKSNTLVNTGLDLFPTICAFANATQPADLEGRRLTRLAQRTETQAKQDFVVVTNHLVQGAPVNGVKPQPRGRMLRTDRYKYVVYNEGNSRESLVDMVDDPGEMVNIAGLQTMQPILQEHRRVLKKWGLAHQDKFPYIP